MKNFIINFISLKNGRLWMVPRTQHNNTQKNDTWHYGSQVERLFIGLTVGYSSKGLFIRYYTSFGSGSFIKYS